MAGQQVVRPYAAAAPSGVCTERPIGASLGRAPLPLRGGHVALAQVQTDPAR